MHDPEEEQETEPKLFQICMRIVQVGFIGFGADLELGFSPVNTLFQLFGALKGLMPELVRELPWIH